jgi:polyphosphate kinase
MVAPFNLRNRLTDLIDRAIKAVRRGDPAEIILKLNNLEDDELIARLYAAATAGVRVRLIVRGICRLVPKKERRVPLEAISIVDRYLEHSRVIVVRAGDDLQVWLASADWMGRNLDRRVEVAFPIYDLRVREEVLKFVELQLSDNVRSRILDGSMLNRYRPRLDAQPEVRAQEAIYQWIQEGSSPKASPAGVSHQQR